MTKLAFRILTLCLILAAAVPAAPLFTLDPIGGAVSGAPGSVVGWGFTITNDADYLLLSRAEFDPATTGFTDLISLQFIVAGPALPVSATYDPVALTGVGSLVIPAGAIPGTVISGTIRLFYDVYTEDPSSSTFSGAPPIATDQQLSAVATITVADEAPVPEPSTLVLAGCALLALAIKRR